MKRISKEAHFALTERESQDEGYVDLIYEGMTDTWGEAVQKEACEDEQDLEGSQPCLDSSSPEDVILMDLAVEGAEGEGSTLSLASTSFPQEEQVSQRDRMEPLHLYQPPQVV